MEHGESAMLWYIPVKVKIQSVEHRSRFEVQIFKSHRMWLEFIQLDIRRKVSKYQDLEYTHLYTQSRGSRQ